MNNIPVVKDKFDLVTALTGRDKARRLRKMMESVNVSWTNEINDSNIPQWKFSTNPVSQKELEERFYQLREWIEQRQRLISQVYNELADLNENLSFVMPVSRLINKIKLFFRRNK